MTDGAANRRKGHNFERLVARRWGVSTTRNTRPGVHDDGGDVLLPGWYVECKDTATWRIAPWFHLAEENAAEGQDVALVLKRRRMPDGDALVVVTLDTFDRMREAAEPTTSFWGDAWRWVDD